MNNITIKSQEWISKRHPRALEHHKEILREAFEAGYGAAEDTKNASLLTSAIISSWREDEVSEIRRLQDDIKKLKARISDVGARLANIENK